MPTPLPVLTYDLLVDELTQLFPSRRVMIRHLVTGLQEDAPSMTPQALLHELLTIVLAASSPPPGSLGEATRSLSLAPREARMG